MKQRRLIRDNKKRKLFKKAELFQKVIKMLFLFHNSFKLMHLARNTLLSKTVINMFKTRLHNYCTVTGRSRGVYRDVKVSRIVFRDFGAQGLFFGLKKASW